MLVILVVTVNSQRQVAVAQALGRWLDYWVVCELLEVVIEFE